MVGGVLGGGSHRKLVHIQSAEGNRPGGPELGNDGGIIGCPVSGKDFRAAGTRFAQNVDNVFNADGNTTEREGDVGFFSLREGGFDVAGEIGADLGIRFSDSGFDGADGIGR